VAQSTSKLNKEIFETCRLGYVEKLFVLQSVYIILSAKPQRMSSVKKKNRLML